MKVNATVKISPVTVGPDDTVPEADRSHSSAV